MQALADQDVAFADTAEQAPDAGMRPDDLDGAVDLPSEPRCQDLIPVVEREKAESATPSRGAS